MSAYEIASDGLIMWENRSSGCICHPFRRYVHVFSDEHTALARDFPHLRSHITWNSVFDVDTNTWCRLTSDKLYGRYVLARETLIEFLSKSWSTPPISDFFDIQITTTGLAIKINVDFAADFPRSPIFEPPSLPTSASEQSWRLLWRITSRGTPEELKAAAMEKYNKQVTCYENLHAWIARIAHLESSEVSLLYPIV